MSRVNVSRLGSVDCGRHANQRRAREVLVKVKMEKAHKTSHTVQTSMYSFGGE